MQPDMLYALMIVTQRDLEDAARRQRLVTELRYARRAERAERRRARWSGLRRHRPVSERPAPTAA